MPDTPRCTACILTYNRRQEVLTSLARLRGAGSLPAQDLEIIIVDNASTDGTDEAVRASYPDVHIVRSDRNQGTPGWNLAFERATAPVILVLDDDAAMAGPMIQRALTVMSGDPGIGILSVDVVDPGTRHSFTRNRPYGIFSFWGCSVFLRTAMVRAIGGFDPAVFIYSHECEYAIRAMKAGWRHAIDMSIEAEHRKDPASYGGFSAWKVEQEFFSRHYAYLKHLTGLRRTRYLILAGINAVGGSLSHSWRTRRPNPALIMRFLSAWRRSWGVRATFFDATERLVCQWDPRVVIENTLFVGRFSRWNSLEHLCREQPDLFPDFDPYHFGKWRPVPPRTDRQSEMTDAG